MVVVLTGKVLFGILGWILAIFFVGFLVGAVVTYRRVSAYLTDVSAYLTEAHEVFEVNKMTKDLFDSVKRESEADRSGQ